MSKSLREKVEIYEKALNAIGAFTDQSGSEYLKETGKYSLFDEPHSVQTAREALLEGAGKPIPEPGD